ncbi:uncharacterized protein VNE69_05177 [Vairimorpha necatrix]|uniref:Uncharacterized protein n=1 Tax=Vairimorpha necatrix TaxID=6039 RepID=A0AAX4JC83_9MICR
MNSCKLMSFFIFIHSWKGVYDRLNTILTNKISKRDYYVIDIKRRYLKVELKYTDLQELNAKLMIETFPWDESKIVKDININCRGKSVRCIVKEFEEVLLLEYEKILADSIILVYNSNFYVVDPIYKKIINYLKEENAKRTELSVCTKIFYDIIDDHYCLWNRIVCSIKHKLKFLGRDPNYYIIPLEIFEKNDECYLNFSIYLDHVYYLFEFNLKELNDETFFNIVEFKSSDTNETNKIISRCFYDLYRFIILEGISLDSHLHSTTFELDRIILFSQNFEIFMISNALRFTNDKENYVCHLNSISCSTGNKNFKKKKTVMILKEFFKKIRLLELDFTKVELFFRLIKNKNKVEYLVNNILNSPDNPCCIIFSYLMLDQELIDENELNILLSVDKLCAERKTQITKRFLTKFVHREYSSYTYIIKYCLFLEAERYLNEIFIINDPIFSALKKIGIFINTKNQVEINVHANSFHSSQNKEIIDLRKIYQEFIELHFKDIKMFRKQIWSYILKLLSLFTGLERCVYKLEFDKCFTQKNKVLDLFRLFRNEVDKNNEAIRKKLTLNLQEDAEKEYRKYFYQIKYLLENKSEKSILKEELRNIFDKIHKFKLNEALNEIMTNALNEKIDHLYDEEVKNAFLNELSERANQAIKNVYRHDIIMKELAKMIRNWDEEYMNELFNEIVEKVRISLWTNIEKNARICCKRELLQVLIVKYEDNFESDLDIDRNYGNYIKQIVKVLSDKEIFEILNGVEINLHDVLVKIYKDQEKENFNKLI